MISSAGVPATLPPPAGKLSRSAAARGRIPPPPAPAPGAWAPVADVRGLLSVRLGVVSLFCAGRLSGTIGRWTPSRAAQTGRRAVRFRLPTPRRRSHARRAQLDRHAGSADGARANVRPLTIRSANPCHQEGQSFRLPQPHPVDALTSAVTADCMQLSRDLRVVGCPAGLRHRPTCCRPPGMFMHCRFWGQYPLLPHSAFKVGRYVAVSRPGVPLDLSLAADGSVTMDSITLPRRAATHVAASPDLVAPWSRSQFTRASRPVSMPSAASRGLLFKVRLRNRFR